MASFNEEIVIKLKDQFTPALEKMTSALTTFKGAAGIGAVVLGLGALEKALAEPVKQYSDFERQTKLLESALRSQGITTATASKDLIDYAKHLQGITTYSDEATVEAEKLLVQFGLTGDMLKKTLVTAMDVATGKGMDLNEVINLLGRAFHGHTETLSRYGISLTEAEKRTGNFGAILNKLNLEFSGRSQADLETYSGQVKSLGNLFGDLMKNIGEKSVGAMESSGILGFLKRGLGGLVGMTETKHGLEAVRDEISKTKSTIDGLNLSNKGSYNADTQAQLDAYTKKLQELEKTEDELLKQKAADVVLTGKQLKSQKERADALNLLENAEKDRKRREMLMTNALELTKFFDTLKAVGGSAWSQIDRDQQEASKQFEILVNKEGNQWANTEENKAKIAKAFSLKRIGIVASEVGAMQGMFDQLGQDENASQKQAASNVLNNMTQMATAINPIFGQIVAGFAAVAKGVMSAMDFMNKSVRGAFGSMTDNLRAFKSAVNDALSALKEFRDYQTQKSKHLAGEIDLDLNTYGGAFRNDPTFQAIFGTQQTPLSLIQALKGGRIKWSVDNGDFVLTEDGESIGIIGYDNPNEVKVMNRMPGVTEAGTRMYVMDIYNWLKSTGKIDLTHKDDTSGEPAAPTVSYFADGGMVFGNNGVDKVRARLSSGEFVVSRKGVNQRSLGMLKQLNEGTMPAGDHMVVQIQAVDAASFEDFMRRDGAKVMRKLSGRDGVVLMNSRGASANI